MAKPPKKKKQLKIDFDHLRDNQFLKELGSSDGVNTYLPDYRRFLDPLGMYNTQQQVQWGYDVLQDWYSNRKGFPQESKEALDVLSNTKGVTFMNMPEEVFGRYSRGMGLDGISEGVLLNSALIPGARRSYDVKDTMIHELNHRAQYNSPAVMKNLEQISKLTGKGKGMGEWEKAQFNYLANPVEVHSRMMEFRHTFDISPNKKFDKKTFDSIKSYIDQQGDESTERRIFNSLYNVVPNDENFIKLMNSVVSNDNGTTPVNNAQHGGFTYNDRLREYFGKRKVNFNPQQVPMGGPIVAPLAMMLSLIGGKQPSQTQEGHYQPPFAKSDHYLTAVPTGYGDFDKQTKADANAVEMDSLHLAKMPGVDETYYQDSEESIPLTEGHLRGAKIQKGIIKDAKAAAEKYGVDPMDILAIAGKESTFGYGPWGEQRRGDNTDYKEETPFTNAISSIGLFTYNDALYSGRGLKGAPKSFMEFAHDKGKKEIIVRKDKTGVAFDVEPRDYLNVFTDDKIVADYKKYLDKFPRRTGVNIFEEVAKRIKEKGIASINPGDSSYVERVQQYKEMLKNNRTPIKFQQGGYASGDPLNFMFPSSGLVPSYAQDGLSGYFEDPLMLPHAKGGGFFGGIWKGIKGVGKAIGKGFGGVGDQLLSFAGMPNVIQNSMYDNHAPKWIKGLNEGIGSVATGVLGAAIPGAGLALGALQGLGNASQGQRGGFGGQMDFSSFGGGQPDANQYNVGSLLQGLMGGGQGFSGQNQQQYGTALGQLFGNFQGRGGFGGINPWGTPGFNPQPRMYEDGGEVQQGPAMIPIQTEKGEVFVHLDGSITPVNAKKTHKQMDDDEVTDVVPEGTYVTSNDKKIRMTLKQAEEIVMGLKALPYEEFTKGKLPEEQLFSEIFGNNKKMTPAEMTQKILKKFPTMDRSTTWNKNDIFTEITNKENMNNRLPWLEQVIMFNESRRGKQPTQTFKHGGVVKMEGVRHLPKGGSVKKFGPGDWVSTAATALPFFMDLFGANKGKSNIDPIARNMILGSAPLYSAGLNANINSQNNQLGQAIQDFTGLGQNLNNFAGAQAGANIAGRALQQTDFKNFDPTLQDQRLANFQTRTPNAVIDALSTPRYDLNALAGTLGPRAFGNFTSQMMNSENETRNNAIINQFNQDRSLGLNVLGQRNALDSFSQQFNIGQGEKQQTARNAQTAGIFGDVSSYFGRLGDIQSQILPITTQFALQKAQLAGQKQMGTAQNLMNTGSIYAQLAGNQQPQQQQQMKQTGNYDFLKNIILQNQQQTQQQIGTIGQNRLNTNRNAFDLYNPYQYPQQLSPMPQITPRNSWDPYFGG